MSPSTLFASTLSDPPLSPSTLSDPSLILTPCDPSSLRPSDACPSSQGFDDRLLRPIADHFVCHSQALHPCFRFVLQRLGPPADFIVNHGPACDCFAEPLLKSVVLLIS